MNNKENKFLGIWVFSVILLFSLFLVGSISSRGTMALEESTNVVKYTERDCGTSSYDSSTGKCSDGTDPKVRYQLGVVLDRTILNDKTAVCQTEYGETSCKIDLPTQEKLDSVVKNIYGWSETKDSCNNLFTGKYELTTETKINTLYPCYNVSSNVQGVCPEGFYEIASNYYDCRSELGASDGFTEEDCDEYGGFWSNEKLEGYENILAAPWCYLSFEDYKVTIKLDDGCGSYEETSCTTKDGEVNCDIDLPDKIGNNTVIGWSETKDSCSSVKTGKYNVFVTTSIDTLYPCFANNSDDVCNNSGESSSSSSNSSISSGLSSSSSSSSSLNSSNSNNGNSNTNSSNNKPSEDADGNITTNPPTGEIIIFIIWLLGFGMIGYSIYCYIKIRNN